MPLHRSACFHPSQLQGLQRVLSFFFSIFLIYFFLCPLRCWQDFPDLTHEERSLALYFRLCKGALLLTPTPQWQQEWKSRGTAWGSVGPPVIPALPRQPSYQAGRCWHEHGVRNHACGGALTPALQPSLFLQHQVSCLGPGCSRSHWKRAWGAWSLLAG